MDGSMVGGAALLVTLVVFVSMYFNIKSPVIYRAFTTLVFLGIIVGAAYLLYTVHAIHQMQ